MARDVMWLEAVGLWFGILVLAMLNGLLREHVLVPRFGTANGLRTSGVILSACILAAAWLATPRWGPLPDDRWLELGGLWLLLTLAFEFGFGRLVQRKSWAELLAAYTCKGGNIWPVVLIVTLLAPWVAALARGLVE